jgi:tetratricopeptide (TPR) repeat protein
MVSEIRRASQSGAKADAPVLWLRGHAAIDGTLNGFREALKFYDESLRLDPKFAPALASRTWINDVFLDIDPEADRDLLIREMDEFSRRAIVAGYSDSRAWFARSLALRSQYRWNEALEALDESLRIDPRDSRVYLERARIMTGMGRQQDALAELDKAVALDARDADDGQVLRARCRAHLLLGHYDDAIKLCERAAPLTIGSPSIYAYLTAAYAQKGEMTKASAAKAQLLRLAPAFTIALLKRGSRLSEAPEYWEQSETHFHAGLRKAGVPEQ